MREILRAIAQCHGLNVLLRDVKPENVRPCDACMHGGGMELTGLEGGTAAATLELKRWAVE